MTVVDISEIPARVSRRDLSFYLVLFLVVLPFWSVVPLAWVFVIHSLRTGKIWVYSKGYLTLFAISLAEVGVTFFSSNFHLV
jgi:hypothetical protein